LVTISGAAISGLRSARYALLQAWAERFFNVKRWTEMPKGGHFAALEEPELLAQDMREFFRSHRT
jgi:pimeloyl-ACP methyl ester carboxylesterase